MANNDWADAAFAAVCEVAKVKSEFTPDDIWDTGLPKPVDSRALGSVMRRASSKKLIEKTGRSQPTRQPKSHRTDINIWRSLIHEVHFEPNTPS